MTEAYPRGIVALLTAQAFAFGVSLALLIVPANSLFLDAYGSEWLPATYVAIAIAGTVVSSLVARAARRTRLAHIASATLGVLAALYLGSWLVLVAGGTWVSAALLVVFPLSLQLGFVFIGGQAGRLLDVRQMKERFPRIVSGFAVGFLVGGLLGLPLLSLLGSTENLLLATTVAQLAFLGLLLITEHRHPEVRTALVPGQAPAKPPLRTLFVSGIALLLLGYQVLSAMGSQIVDFLLFDRAAARYEGDDLTRFLSTYTAVLNLADILFLALLAGPLLRRFGLRLGLLLNPVVVGAILALMTLVVAGPGAATLALFALAGVLRITDIAATDGTTRTSINAAYQVVPARERLAVQSVVEGIGVPVAIGLTGVLLLGLEALDLGVGAVIVLGLALAGIWTALAVAVYRAYVSALAGAMLSPAAQAPDLGAAAAESVVAMRALLRSTDTRDVRLGLDLLSNLEGGGQLVELRHLTEHADPAVRLLALTRLAAIGDERAANDGAALLRTLAVSPRAADRKAAAAALAAGGLASADRWALTTLLTDADPSVRVTALDALGPGDGEHAELVLLALRAAREPWLAGRATAALRRLGRTTVMPLAAAMAQEGPHRSSLVRAAAAVAADHGIAAVAPALADPDRAIVLTALEALEAAGGHGLVPAATHDALLRDAGAHAARAATAGVALGDGHETLRRALDDELNLARRTVIALLALRHGERVRAAVRVVDHAEGQRRGLALEALDVVISRDEAAIAIPLVRRDLTADRHSGWSPEAWLDDLTHDPEGVWRSSWLAVCAAHAA